MIVQLTTFIMMPQLPNSKLGTNVEHNTNTAEHYSRTHSTHIHGHIICRHLHVMYMYIRYTYTHIYIYAYMPIYM